MSGIEEVEIGRLTFVWDLWLGGLCTCIQVIPIDPKLDPEHKLVLSLSFDLCYLNICLF